MPGSLKNKRVTRSDTHTDLFTKSIHIKLTENSLTWMPRCGIISELTVEGSGHKYDMRKCWNRQTGTFEVRVSLTCGFKSHLPHQSPRYSRIGALC